MNQMKNLKDQWNNPGKRSTAIIKEIPNIAEERKKFQSHFFTLIMLIRMKEIRRVMSTMMIWPNSSPTLNANNSATILMLLPSKLFK